MVEKKNQNGICEGLNRRLKNSITATVWVVQWEIGEVGCHVIWRSRVQEPSRAVWHHCWVCTELPVGVCWCRWPMWLLHRCGWPLGCWSTSFDNIKLSTVSSTVPLYPTCLATTQVKLWKALLLTIIKLVLRCCWLRLWCWCCDCGRVSVALSTMERGVVDWVVTIMASQFNNRSWSSWKEMGRFLALTSSTSGL